MTKLMTNLRHLDIKGCGWLRRMPVGMGNLSCLRTLSMFVVAPGTGHGITELQGLDHLTGELQIKGLQHVRNSKDAKNANLMRKEHLGVLSLDWLVMYNDTRTIEEKEEEEVASIGEGLKPHPNIRVLELKGYNGLKFPSWMSHSCLPNLVEISLRWCRRCEHLVPFGQLPLLKVLRICGMNSVKCIGDEFYGDHLQGSSSSLFPSLRKLEICEMRNLEEWYAPSSKEGPAFPSLKGLSIEGCPKLRTLPTTLSSALTELILDGECNEMMLESSSSSSLVKVIGCLQKLEINFFKKIKTLPKVFMENLPSTLTELRIHMCSELVCLPEGVMQNLTCLNSFKILGCRSLKVLPELGSKNNTALRSLHIESCDGLTSVSDCLRHQTTLGDLIIHSCRELKFLPDDFQDLTSLRYVEFSYLPLMTCLPEGLQQAAGTLESLIIERCHPDLHRKCAKETGEDWHKIAHVPNLRIPVTTGWETEHGIGGGMKCNMIPCFSSSSSSSCTN